MELPKRKQNRINEFDYSRNGAYFVTICTHNRRNLLSRIRRGDPCGRPQVELLPLGKIADQTFAKVEAIYPIRFDYRVIMPNHIHYIVFLPMKQENGVSVPALGRIVGAYKSMIAKEWLSCCKANNRKMGDIWQRNYYEHVIRNEQDLYEVRQYIENNPSKWEEDKMYCRGDPCGRPYEA